MKARKNVTETRRQVVNVTITVQELEEMIRNRFTEQLQNFKLACINSDETLPVTEEVTFTFVHEVTANGVEEL